MKQLPAITAVAVASLLLVPTAHSSEFTPQEIRKWDKGDWYNAGVFLGRMESLCLAANSQLVDPRNIPDILAVLISSAEKVTLDSKSPHRINEFAIQVLKFDSPDCIKFLPKKYQGPPRTAQPRPPVR